MGFSEELTLLVVLILVLGLAYMGLSYWTRHQKSKSAGDAGSVGGIDAGAGMGIGDGFEATAGGDGGTSVGSASGSRSEREERRVSLQGRDAEVAAKVLKRMLKQGRDDAKS